MKRSTQVLTCHGQGPREANSGTGVCLRDICLGVLLDGHVQSEGSQAGRCSHSSLLPSSGRELAFECLRDCSSGGSSRRGQDLGGGDCLQLQSVS